MVFLVVPYREMDRSESGGISKTICQMCGYEMCGIEVLTKNDKVVRIEPMKEFPFNHSSLCPKGFAAKELIYHPNRLRHPLKKDGDNWKKISWNEALDFLAKRLVAIRDTYGPQALVTATGSSKLSARISEGALLKRFMNMYGTPNHVTSATVCQYPRAFADTVTAGSPFHRHPDLANTDCIICWGCNPSASHFPTTWIDILETKKRGARLIVVDPRVTATALKADIHVQPRPGTDGALAFGLLNVAIDEGLYDKVFVERWTVGFEELVTLVKDYSPEMTERITSVPKELIEKVARIYATTERACMFLGNSLDHTTNAIQNIRAIDNCIRRY